MDSPTHIFYSATNRKQNPILYITHIFYAYFLRKQFVNFVCNKDFVRALGPKSYYCPASSLDTSNLRSCTVNRQNKVLSFIERNTCRFLSPPPWV